MSHALLISDNQTLNNLYAVNLNAYVAINVKILTDYSKGFELLINNPIFDVVICLDNKKHREKIIEIMTLAKELESPIPVILLGTTTEVCEEKFITIPNQYSIKEVVRSVANFLHISAKDMANKEVPKYFPIPVSFLQSLDNSSCDIFYRNETSPFVYDYFVIINKDQKLEDSINKLTSEGTDFLYVESKSRLNFINATSSYILAELNNEDVSAIDKVKMLSHGFEFVGDQLMEHPQAIDEIKEISNVCIKTITSVVNEIPKLSTLLSTLLSSKGEYVYIHTVLATFIANHIIDNMDWGSKEQKEKVAYVLFFHDIFLVTIFKKYPHLYKEEDMLFSPELSDHEKNIVLEHAKMAGELVCTFKSIPIGADMLITQHHGATSGKGFALTFKDDISPISKVTLIAEELAYHLFMLRKQGKKFSENKAQVIAEIKDKFKNHTYQKIIKTIETLEA